MQLTQENMTELQDFRDQIAAIHGTLPNYLGATGDPGGLHYSDPYFTIREAVSDLDNVWYALDSIVNPNDEFGMEEAMS
jgi:hypothetical protein